MPAKTPKTSVKTTRANRTTPASHDAPESSTPGEATRLDKALTVLHKALGQPAPANVAPMTVKPPSGPGEPPAAPRKATGENTGVTSLAGTYAALEAYAASPRETAGGDTADREPFDELAEYRERTPSPVVDSKPVKLAPDRAERETDADGPEDGRPALVLDHSNFDVTKHNGYLTIKSPKTGDHRTFSIETVTNENSGLFGKRIISLLIGPNRDLYTSWKGFAFADSFGVKVWRKFTNTVGKSEYEKFAAMLENPARFAAKGVEYKLETHCARCGKSLTHPDSIDSGMGPICRGKAGL